MVVEGGCKTVFWSFIGEPRKLSAMAKPVKQVWVRHMVAFENQKLLTVLTAGPMQSHDWKNQRWIERNATWQRSTSVLGWEMGQVSFFTTEGHIEVGKQMTCSPRNGCLWCSAGSRNSCLWWSVGSMNSCLWCSAGSRNSCFWWSVGCMKGCLW